MSFSPLCWLLPAVLFPMLSSAQTQSSLTEAAASHVLQYRPVLDQYRRFADQPVARWDEINNTVGRIGGWRTYAREARQLEPRAESGAPTANGRGTEGDRSGNMSGSQIGHGVKP